MVVAGRGGAAPSGEESEPDGERLRMRHRRHRAPKLAAQQGEGAIGDGHRPRHSRYRQLRANAEDHARDCRPGIEPGWVGRRGPARCPTGAPWPRRCRRGSRTGRASARSAPRMPTGSPRRPSRRPIGHQRRDARGRGAADERLDDDPDHPSRPIALRLPLSHPGSANEPGLRLSGCPFVAEQPRRRTTGRPPWRRRQARDGQ